MYRFVVTYTTLFLFLFKRRAFSIVIEEIHDLNQLLAAIENKWNADLYYEGSDIIDGIVYYEDEVIEINKSIERCEAAIESTRKRALAHTEEEIQMKERGNDCDAFVSVNTRCQQVEMRREMEMLKEEKCAKENDKAKGNELAVPVAPVPVAARVLNALAVTVVDTDPLYDGIVTQSPRKKPRKPSPTPPPLKNDIVIERAKLIGGSFFTTNDEPTHSKTDILEYDTTSLFGMH